MAGGSVIFYIFLCIMIVLLIRWSIRVFINKTKPVAVTEHPRLRHGSSANVQRSTVYTIADDPLADDQRGFPDFFWNVSPHTSRSRDVIHKDDKDLPSYEEVMQMEMRQQVVGLPAATVAALPATPANETTFTTTSERVRPATATV